jgi:hypothetical protein
LVVGYLPWWLEFSVALGLLLASRGAQVDLGFVPYRRWTAPDEPFDAGRQRAYLRSVLRTARPLRPIDLSRPGMEAIPQALVDRLESLARTDVEYTLQQESPNVSVGSAARRLLDLRRDRNRAAASRAWALLRRTAYDAVVIPNGSILEFGAVYQTARFLGMPTVTYEFGEQRERVWICRDGEAMRLDTDGLWEARGRTALTEVERAQIEGLLRARKGGIEWRQFGRLWQRAERRGSPEALRRLGVDGARPVVLLATNVVGDSLALNRQVFTQGMADWLSRTLQVLAARSDVQTIVRVHPGELLGAGMPSETVVKTALPDVPSHVVLIPPDSTTNTYDLIEAAHVGLVYTSTAGLEMAMHGVPVVTAGGTHYRGKGFTDDPCTWDDYVAVVQRRLGEPVGRTLSEGHIELAWRYAYRFFFEFPFAFPWHLLHFWKDVETRPLEGVASPEGRRPYEETLGVMAGELVDWDLHARRV